MEESTRMQLGQSSSTPEDTTAVRPLLETPATYIGRLNSATPIVIYTHSNVQTRARNKRAEKYLAGVQDNFAVLYLDKIGDEGRVLEIYLRKTTSQMRPPWIFILGQHRPLNRFFDSFHDGMIEKWLRDPDVTYTYDLIILGVGPGSVTAAKTAVSYGRRVLICIMGDSKEKPFPDNIFELILEKVDQDLPPKKRYKKASKDCRKICTRAWQDKVGVLKELGVNVIQAKEVQFKNSHTIHVPAEHKDYTGLNFLLTLNRQRSSKNKLHKKGRTITIEEFLWKARRPLDDTLVLGKSTLAIEVATFLHNLGVSVTLMYPGVILKKFEQECVEKILSAMVDAGIQVESCIMDNISKGKDLEVKIVRGHDPATQEKFKEEYRTVVDATEQGFNKRLLNLADLGMDVTGSHVLTNGKDQTSVRNIYAIGAIVHGRRDGARVSERAGELLAERLFGMQETLMDRSYLPTVINSVVEFGCVGLSEKKAKKVHGAANIVVYRALYGSFDHLLDPELKRNFVKVVCVRPSEFRESKFDFDSGQQLPRTEKREVTEREVSPETKALPEEGAFSKRTPIPVYTAISEGEIPRRLKPDRGHTSPQPGERIVGLHILAENVEPMLSGFSLALRKSLFLSELDTSRQVDLSNIFQTDELVRESHDE